MPLNYIKLKSNSKRQVKVQSSSIILEKSVQIRTRKKSVYGHFSLSVYSWEKVLRSGIINLTALLLCRSFLLLQYWTTYKCRDFLFLQYQSKTKQKKNNIG